ncbi:MAG: hypothetical protein JXA96_13125 [Sedimentisphaerales bacterium]|nr:hypothetical protein [Sedimentisphaerales bacterium]
METTKQPKAKFTVGGISAALWENQITVNGQTRTILKASVSRRYKDKNGAWKTTQTFARNEIPLALYCLQKAFEWMIEQSNDLSSEETVEQEPVI